MGNFDHYVYGNKVHVLTPEPLTEGTVHASPFLLQLDIFGKLLKCLTKVCYLKLKKKKLRYLDKLRLSEPVQASGLNMHYYR